MGTYINNLAKSLIGQLGVKVEEISSTGWLAADLYERYGKAVHVQLLRMRPETLGKIAAAGKGCTAPLGTTSLHGVFREDESKPWLNLCSDGATLLRGIACAAIIAEMADIINSQH